MYRRFGTNNIRFASFAVQLRQICQGREAVPHAESRWAGCRSPGIVFAQSLPLVLYGVRT
jgi:hypothetical protein